MLKWQNHGVRSKATHIYLFGTLPIVTVRWPEGASGVAKVGLALGLGHCFVFGVGLYRSSSWSR